nr:MAG TPA: Protein of unknown function (DUF1353) [Caudoviricetes sp.]
MGSFTSPPIVKMHGLRRWEMFASFTYYRDPIKKSDGSIKTPEEYTEEDKHLRSFEKIVVPSGFITDLATIPRVFWSLFPPHDDYAKAAILHDYMYENAIASKAEADIILYEAMQVLGVPKWKSKLFYLAVKYFGTGNY